MDIDFINAVKKLKEDGWEVGDIAEKMNADTSVIRESLNKEIGKNSSGLVEKMEKLFDESDNIVTTAQLKKLNEEAWNLYGEALNNNRIKLAERILKTILRQVKMTSKKLGELDPRNKQGKNIPPDFVEHLMDVFERENLLKEGNGRED